VAIRLRPPERRGAAGHFGPTDPPRGWDLARHPRVARLLHNRRFQFALILPNQIIFWLVILLGVAGTVIPGLNFGTAITWYLWFCLVFVLMVVVGRAWCVMCPFGGFAEWIQRRSLWRRTQQALGRGRKLPAPVARWGFLLSIGTFLLLTWIEEFFNIAGPGTPSATSFMVIGIVASALVFFLVFERRTFCRYLCPLTALIGTVGAMGSAAGFRTRDREVCLSCTTKDCMRGSEEGYGCPWYTWPGSADANLACGLCTECYKSCPSENIGLYLQPPLTSIVAPRRRRADVAIGVLLLWGLVLFQQFNATNAYATIDGWLNRWMHFPQYPNPVDYLGLIALGAAVTAVAIWGVAKAAGSGSGSVPGVAAGSGSGSAPAVAPGDRGSLLSAYPRFRSFLLPLAYGLIPVVGADYFARQLPKMFKHVTRLIPSIGSWFGAGSTHSALYNTRLLTDPQIVLAQVVVIALGTLAAVWVTWRITTRELASISARPVAVRVTSLGLVLACGGAAAFFYLIMHAAS
jgi:polyferredoxin